MSGGVRLQNLRDFTVQIRDSNGQIVGTGIVVSADGRIVTCAHIVRAAGVEPRNSHGAEIEVYFPQARGRDVKSRRATVAKFFDSFDDDIVMLALTDGSAPLTPEQIPVLGTATASAENNNAFRSYGYRRLDKYNAGWADGMIQGCVEVPEESNIQCEPVQLTSSEINRGMSGSAVLDLERNLVVGIVCETWFPDLSTKDRDTAWALDARVLGLPPFGLPLHDEPLPLKAAPRPKTDEKTRNEVIQAAQSTAIGRGAKERHFWNNAPTVLEEWTGRQNLLRQITDDWNNPQKRVTGLIGFGGEGKSSLARKWVDTLIMSDIGRSTSDGIFWWGFSEDPNLDDFLEAALKYFGVDCSQYKLSSQRAHLIGDLLTKGRHVFVLDGFETMQYQHGDQYGSVRSKDLHDLLTFFAGPDSQSFCLITSRVPLLNLIDYTTYSHRDVDRLSLTDGKALLKKLGLRGSNNELAKIVSDWDGYALTLSLLAAHLVARYGGNVHDLADIPVPSLQEPRYRRVERVLHEYDLSFNEGEREFLKLFSVFRVPVHESALNHVLELLGRRFDKRAFRKLVTRLVSFRVLRYNRFTKFYTAHVLIRNYYFELFNKDDAAQKAAAHDQIKNYYLAIAGNDFEHPRLDYLQPLIEAVHHACQAGAYDEAFAIYDVSICQTERHVLVHELAAFETDLDLMGEFFLNRDTSTVPLVSRPEHRAFILNEIGFCHISLGRPSVAAPIQERAIKEYLECQDWHDACVGYRNLADMHAYVGALSKSMGAAEQALDLARQDKNNQDECQSLCHYAWASFLLGNTEDAAIKFLEAQQIQQTFTPYVYLYSNRGIFFADYLQRVGEYDYARSVTNANLEICEVKGWTAQMSWCHRVLGDLDFEIGADALGYAHYEEALALARGVSHRAALIEVLLARGRSIAKNLVDRHPTQRGTIDSKNSVFSDLKEALHYAVDGHYSIYEIDIRIAFSWAYLAFGEKQKAKASAERALRASQEFGYHWGKVDALEALAAVG